MNYNEQILKADPTPIVIKQIEKNVHILVSGNLPEELQDFRKIIFDAWWTLNDELERVLSKHLFQTSHKLYWKDKKREKKFREFADVTQKIFEKLSFSDRVILAREYNLIDASLSQRLTRISKIRNEFSHPKLMKLQKYQNISVRNSILLAVQGCIFELGGISSRFGL